jgi:hypothetical protein
MIDCIASYHLNPWTCGIAKFNVILGGHFGVPVVGLGSDELRNYRCPLVSIRLAEFTPEHAADVDRSRPGEFELLLHGFAGDPIEQRLVAAASRVSCVNRELFRSVEPIRPDVAEVFCPGMLESAQRFHPTDISVFTFGMAHKIRVPLYRKLRDLLEATGKTYSMYVSTALHENTSFDDSFVVRFEELQTLFNGRVHFMGYLSDAAVYNHLVSSTYVAAFFEKGLRSNNTTVNAAMEHGCTVITNLDEHSPEAMTHMKNVVDINLCDRLPNVEETERIGRAAMETVKVEYAWDRLVAQLRPVVRT